MQTVRAPAEELWRYLRLPGDAISRLQLSEDPDPIVDSSFKISTAAQVCLLTTLAWTEAEPKVSDLDRFGGSSGSSSSSGSNWR